MTKPSTASRPTNEAVIGVLFPSARQSSKPLRLKNCSRSTFPVSLTMLSHRCLGDWTPGPDPLKLLLRLLGSHFDHGDSSAAFAKIRHLRGANGTPFVLGLFSGSRLAIIGVKHRGQEIATIAFKNRGQEPGIIAFRNIYE